MLVANLSLNFLYYAKRYQGSEVCDHIWLLNEPIFDTRLHFEKNRFFLTLIAKKLQKQAKNLWKMLFLKLFGNKSWKKSIFFQNKALYRKSTHWKVIYDYILRSPGSVWYNMKKWETS